LTRAMMAMIGNASASKTRTTIRSNIEVLPPASRFDVTLFQDASGRGLWGGAACLTRQQVF
jgi:hypothetical protein